LCNPYRIVIKVCQIVKALPLIGGANITATRSSSINATKNQNFSSILFSIFPQFALLRLQKKQADWIAACFFILMLTDYVPITVSSHPPKQGDSGGLQDDSLGSNRKAVVGKVVRDARMILDISCNLLLVPFKEGGIIQRVTNKHILEHPEQPLWPLSFAIERTFGLTSINFVRRPVSRQ